MNQEATQVIDPIIDPSKIRYKKSNKKIVSAVFKQPGFPVLIITNEDGRIFISGCKYEDLEDGRTIARGRCIEF